VSLLKRPAGEVLRKSHKALPSLPPGLRVLVVDDEPDVRRGLELLVNSLGAESRTASCAEDALGIVSDWHPQLVLSDITMGRMSGLDLLDAIKRDHPQTQVILITGYGTIKLAVTALQKGAAHFVTKPFDNEDILEAVHELGQKTLVDEELKRLSGPESPSHEIITRASGMQGVLATIEQVAATRVTVLIQGESGTGKEMVARAIHRASAERDKPFLALNTAALPDGLIEAELFGHERGAFTGADQARIGLFEQAQSGTVFLDEIGLMSPSFQVRLLRVLQEKTVIPLGSNCGRPVDFRLITATSSDLLEQIKNGSFRQDLYYRVHVVRIDLPPLRDRHGDVSLLARHFLKKYSPLVRAQATPPELSNEALEMLERHSWPGNVRELENCIQRALVLCRGEEIRPEHLGLGKVDLGGIPADEPDLSYEENKQLVVRSFQRRFIEKSLARADGNVTRAAESCQLTRAAFQRIMRALNIDRKTFLSERR